MKPTFLGRLLIFFSAALLLAYGTICACGGDWDWDYRYDNRTNFAPEAFADQTYAPLFLSEELFYKTSGLESYSRFDGHIVTDWVDYLKGKMDRETVQYFLIDSSAIDVGQINSYYHSKIPNKSVEKWAGKFDLNDKQVAAFITFLKLAKQVESASVYSGDWDYGSNPGKGFYTSAFIDELNDIYQKAPDKFLKNRYWFQVIKGYFYGEQPELAVDFFNKTERSVPKNILYYRALSYLAGLHNRLGNFAESNYCYSKVFQNCPEMRDVAVFCFHPQEEQDWQGALTLAKTPDEKCALWAIHGYYGDEERAIEAIYKLNPKSEYLDFLLTRVVNNQELKINHSFRNKTVQQKREIIKDTISDFAVRMIDEIASAGKVKRPYLWHAAAGYMETLHGNFNKAEDYFKKAESQMPQTELAVSQVRLLRFVNKLSKMDDITPSDETALVADLRWLYVDLPKQEITDFRYLNATDWSKNYLSAIYRARKDVVMSELFVRDSSYYDDPIRLEKMKIFLEKNDKSPFEKVAAGIYNVDLDDIYTYESVMATFEDRIPEAIALMEHARESQATIFHGNPFNGNIKDCHDCDWAAFQKSKYTQIQFLQTIKEMKAKISNSEDVYTNCLLLGNAFYNITHFGNGRIFHEGNIMGYGYTPFDFRKPCQAIITNCSLAKAYYQKAFESAKNDEQRAKCQYMLSKCERNAYYSTMYNQFENEWEITYSGVNFLAWDGFKALKSKYFKTKYYKEVIHECGYFATYVGARR